MRFPEKTIKHVVRDTLQAANFKVDKTEVQEIADFIAEIRPASKTATTAALIRKLDSYHGVSEKTLQVGTHIYDLLWADGED